jgi:hypothetical protein
MILDELFKSDEEILLDNIIAESASMAWGKRGDQVVKKYRCLSGPRKGRLVNTPSDCAKKLDLQKSKRMKRNLAVQGKKMARKARRTKRVSPVSKQIQKRNLLMNGEHQVNEANVVGSAVHLNTVPEKYRQYELIGRGATSIVFKKDEDTVIIITRDPMKKDWLNQHNDTKYIETLDIPHPIRQMAEKPVYVYEMPMLYPLSKENKRKVSAIVKKFEEVYYRTKDHQKLINKLIELAEVDFADEKSFNKFVGFISDYDKEQFSFDLFRRNFMQSKDGELILSDPVVDKEILDLFLKRRREKYT